MHGDGQEVASTEDKQAQLVSMFKPITSSKTPFKQMVEGNGRQESSWLVSSNKKGGLGAAGSERGSWGSRFELSNAKSNERVTLADLEHTRRDLFNSAAKKVTISNQIDTEKDHKLVPPYCTLGTANENFDDGMFSLLQHESVNGVTPLFACKSPSRSNSQAQFSQSQEACAGKPSAGGA